jgi:hypothetical protein
MLEKLTKDFINKLIFEFNKADNKDKLEKKIINPILSNFAERIYPYVSLLFIMYSLNLILIIIVLILLIIYNKNNKL